MTLAVVHGLIIALFLAAGARLPRCVGAVLTRDTLINLTNGIMLASLRMGVAAWLATESPLPRCNLSAVKGFVPQLLTVFLLTDFTRYWLHYLHHRIPLLWRFHAVHHSTERLDASAGLRMHVVDFVQLSLVPVVLFGIFFDASTFDARVWPALVITTDLFDAFQHANIDMRLEHPLARAWNLVFNNPVFHSWHHSNDPRALNRNFGQALTLWDRLFNTHHTRTECALDVGLPPDERLRNSLWGLQLLLPAGPATPPSEPSPRTFAHGA